MAALKFLTSGFSTSGLRTDTITWTPRDGWESVWGLRMAERGSVLLFQFTALIHLSPPFPPHIQMSSWTKFFISGFSEDFFFSPNSSRSCSVLIFKFVKTLSSFFLLIFKMLILFLASIFTDVYLKPYHETKLSSNNIL